MTDLSPIERVLRPIRRGKPGLVAVSATDPGGLRQAPSNYYESNFVSRRWRKGLANMVKELLPEGWEQMKLLDVGVGDGYTIRLVKPEGEVVGIDTDGSMGMSAMAKGVTFRDGSAYQIPFPDASFEIVTCIEVVEHLEKPEAALVELARVLKPGGYTIMTTPVPKATWRFLWWGWTRFGPGKRWETSPHVTDMHMWSKSGSTDGLADSLQRLGFTIEGTASCNLGYIAGVRAKKAL